MITTRGKAKRDTSKTTLYRDCPQLLVEISDSDPDGSLYRPVVEPSVAGVAASSCVVRAWRRFSI
jgi:hypothetical protein